MMIFILIAVSDYLVTILSLFVLRTFCSIDFILKIPSSFLFKVIVAVRFGRWKEIAISILIVLRVKRQREWNLLFKIMWVLLTFYVALMWSTWNAALWIRYIKRLLGCRHGLRCSFAILLTVHVLLSAAVVYPRAFTLLLMIMMLVVVIRAHALYNGIVVALIISFLLQK